MTIVQWADYECPACFAVHPVIEQTRRTYSDDIAVVYRHWPLRQHPMAYSAALAAECAASAGVFKRFHDYLYEDRSWITEGVTGFAAAIASRLPRVDTVAFKQCLQDDATRAAIEQDIEAVRRLGGRGTPTLLVNLTLLARVPDQTELLRYVEDAMLKR